MENPIQSAISDSLPEPDVIVAPSATPDVNADPSIAAPAEVTAQKAGQGKEPPFHEHPRWKELQEERRQLLQQNQKLMDILEKQQAPKVESARSDPFAKYPEAERPAWQEIYNIAKMAAQEVAEKEGRPILQDIEQQKSVVAAMAYAAFQQRHPDIKPGSSEEAQVAEKIRAGYHPEDAYIVVMSPKQNAALQAQIKSRETAKTKDKIAANLEFGSVPANSPISQKPKTFREVAATAVEEFMKGRS